jgi:hypothetical protein
MCPSTEATDAQREFAANLLRNLLRRIDTENPNEERHTFLVSHASTEGPLVYVVFTARPSDKTWGLVRDTRTSIIDPGPWPDLDEAVLYYYLLDFEENWPGRFPRQPGEPDTIQWPATEAQVFLSTHRTFQKHIGTRRRQMRRPPNPAQEQIGP